LVEVYHYYTLAGDTWDSIALDFYHEERMAATLIRANLRFRSVLTFTGGELIQVPIVEQQQNAILPPWKRV
jgi:hypothetical protein